MPMESSNNIFVVYLWNKDVPSRIAAFAKALSKTPFKLNSITNKMNRVSQTEHSDCVTKYFYISKFTDLCIAANTWEYKLCVSIDNEV